MTTEQQTRIGIIGAGAVGSTLALDLTAAGHRIAAVMSRTPARAEELAARVPGAVVPVDGTAFANTVDVAFLTVPDDSITTVAREIPWRRGMSAVHCSGGTPIDALSAAGARGVSIGGFHPLQTFAGFPASPGALRGVTIAIEAPDPDLRALLYRLAGDVGANGIDLTADARALYHVSGVLASNYVVALAAAAAELWARFGYNRTQGLAALLPLMRGTVDNLAREGLPDALTGPIVRGDAGTVAAHVAALNAHAPDVLPLYRALARRTVRVALETKKVGRGEGDEILALVDDPPKAGGALR